MKTKKNTKRTVRKTNTAFISPSEKDIENALRDIREYNKECIEAIDKCLKSIKL